VIILTTTLYEKNFRQVLNPDNWFFKVKSPLISKKLFIVNNINSKEEFDAIKNQIQDKVEFVYSDDIWKEAVSTFKCDLHQGEISYWYSIQYFCALHIALQEKIKYVFNVGSDCKMSDLEIDDYLRDSAFILDKDPSVLLTTIPWSDEDFDETGQHEQNIYNIEKRHDLFWFSKVVSDQVFFSSPEKFLNTNFNIKSDLHPFPGYGGNSFEKRLCNHLITSDCYRAIYKKYSYFHKSF